eukprot:m.222133 g.222133  ORF g.222133 m.222133 type:complete len:147 (+) comp54172_c1_seq17:135-575(+)
MLLSFRLSPLPPVVGPFVLRSSVLLLLALFSASVSFIYTQQVSLQSRQCQRRQLWSRGHFEISVGAPQFLFSGMSNLNPVAGGGSSDDCLSAVHTLCICCVSAVSVILSSMCLFCVCSVCCTVLQVSAVSAVLSSVCLLRLLYCPA